LSIAPPPSHLVDTSRPQSASALKHRHQCFSRFHRPRVLAVSGTWPLACH
jgi:hypothetical protein